MIRTKEEILTTLKEKFGESTDDETLGIIEDITDTFDDFETKTADSTDWEQKYKDNDAEWRKKYRDRFFKSDGGKSPDEDEVDPEQSKRPLRFEDLFTVKE